MNLLGARHRSWHSFSSMLLASNEILLHNLVPAHWLTRVATSFPNLHACISLFFLFPLPTQEQGKSLFRSSGCSGLWSHHICAGSVVGAHRLIYSKACSILLCPLHWQAESLPLSHQGSPRKFRSFCVVEPLVFWFYNWYLCYGVLNRVYYFILFLLWGHFIILWCKQACVP